MNNIFKKQEMIQLGEGYALSPDGFRGIILTFSEERERTNKKTNVKENFTFEEKYFYPSLGQALKRYVELSQNSAKSLEEVIEKTDKILSIVEDFKNNFKNW